MPAAPAYRFRPRQGLAALTPPGAGRGDRGRAGKGLHGATVSAACPAAPNAPQAIRFTALEDSATAVLAGRNKRLFLGRGNG